LVGLRSILKASTGTAEVTRSINSVFEVAAENGTASSQVLSAAVELAKSGETLKGQMEGFLREVRAA